MTLIATIRDDILKPDVRPSSLLRKAKVLAHRLKSVDFEAWVDRELNGYADAKDLPDYRILQCLSFGNFVGPFRASGNNLPIITAGLPEVIRSEVEKLATKLYWFSSDWWGRNRQLTLFDQDL